MRNCTADPRASAERDCSRRPSAAASAACHRNTTVLHRHTTTARNALPDRSHTATDNRRGVDMVRQHRTTAAVAITLALTASLAPTASADPAPLARAEAAIAATQQQSHRRPAQSRRANRDSGRYLLRTVLGGLLRRRRQLRITDLSVVGEPPSRCGSTSFAPRHSRVLRCLHPATRRARGHAQQRLCLEGRRNRRRRGSAPARNRPDRRPRRDQQPQTAHPRPACDRNQLSHQPTDPASWRSTPGDRGRGHVPGAPDHCCGTREEFEPPSVTPRAVFLCRRRRRSRDARQTRPRTRLVRS